MDRGSRPNPDQEEREDVNPSTTLKESRLRLITTKKENSRTWGLFQCECGDVAWCRLDISRTRFRSCNCPVEVPKVRSCTKCLVLKPSNDFYRDKMGGRRPVCKICWKAQSESWRARNLERAKETSRANSRRGSIRKRYGLTEAQYDSYMKKFGSACGICGGMETQRHKRTLSMDHCHKTGAIRGALCSLCNSMLGLARDRVDILEKAVLYLKRHP